MVATPPAIKITSATDIPSLLSNINVTIGSEQRQRRTDQQPGPHLANKQATEGQAAGR